MKSINSLEDKRSFRFESNGAQIVIHNLDCLQGMRDLVEAGSVDVVVTSPPYNIGVKYGQYDDTISRDRYLAWMREAGEAVKRCLKDEGSFFLNKLDFLSNRILPPGRSALTTLSPAFPRSA